MSNIKNYHLDEEELEILQAFESGNLKRSATEAQDIAFAKEAARNYLAEKEKQSINIELTREDLWKIKTTAESQDLPYEQLISSVLHKFATDLPLPRDI